MTEKKRRVDRITVLGGVGRSGFCEELGKAQLVTDPTGWYAEFRFSKYPSQILGDPNLSVVGCIIIASKKGEVVYDGEVAESTTRKSKLVLRCDPSVGVDGK